MRRMIVLLVAVVAVLAGLLTFRLRVQAAVQNAPSGGSGEIEGTDVDLSSRVSARVVEVKVKKGDQVKPGELLLLLDCSDPRAQLDEAEARLVAARAQAAAQVAQRDAAERQTRRLEAVAADVSYQSRDQTRASAEGLSQQTRAAEAQIRAAEAALARARILAGECEIRAPREAVVNDLPHEVGELVLAGQPLVKLVVLEPVKATFYLPNAELAAARPGARALVVADAWPGERFEGAVTTVGARAEFTPRNIQTRSDRDRLVYPIEVTVPNPQRKLRPGMPVQVTLPGTGR